MKIKFTDMTTFMYTLPFDDSESITLQAALQHYLSHCKQELSTNHRAPFYAHEKYAEGLLKRLEERRYRPQRIFFLIANESYTPFKILIRLPAYSPKRN